ncbi:MAG: hypothetical protein ACPGJS_18425 [Flammeovirgaceae bacterium]
MRNFLFTSFVFLSLLLCTSILLAQSNDSTQVDQGVYDGKLKRGFRHGYGTCTWKDGRKYEGRWKNNLMNGKGTMTYPNGDRYSGDWQNGVRSGYGTYTWKNGATYTGAFFNGRKNGWGILKQPNGEKHEGYWKNDMANGKGKHFWPDGTQYYGDWKNNQRDGSGVLEYADGSVVQGEWAKDKYLPCSCDSNSDTLSIEQRVETYEAVFIGTVTEIYQEETGTDAIVFEILQYWKGQHGFNRKVTLHAGFSSCDFIFYEGESYLIFANMGTNKYYKADKCSPSGELRMKQSVVKQLEKLTCMTKPKKQPFEIRDFDPVCGCDGKTYENPYKAQAKGVSSWKKGACK